MDEDQRNILFPPPSSYSDTVEGRLLKRLREKALRKGCKVTNVPDGYSGIIRTVFQCSVGDQARNWLRCPLQYNARDRGGGVIY